MTEKVHHFSILPLGFKDFTFVVPTKQIPVLHRVGDTSVSTLSMVNGLSIVKGPVALTFKNFLRGCTRSRIQFPFLLITFGLVLKVALVPWSILVSLSRLECTRKKHTLTRFVIELNRWLYWIIDGKHPRPNGI